MASVLDAGNNNLKKGLIMNKIQEINTKRDKIRNKIDGFEKAIPVYPTMQINLHGSDKLDLDISEMEEVLFRLYKEGEKRTVKMPINKDNAIKIAEWILDNLTRNDLSK